MKVPEFYATANPFTILAIFSDLHYRLLSSTIYIRLSRTQLAQFSIRALTVDRALQKHTCP